MDVTMTVWIPSLNVLQSVLTLNKDKKTWWTTEVGLQTFLLDAIVEFFKRYFKSELVQWQEN